MTVPGISPIDRGEWRETWYWSFTAASTHRMLEGHIGSDLKVETYGNVLTATAFLQGIAAEELSPEELRHYGDFVSGDHCGPGEKAGQRCSYLISSDAAGGYCDAFIHELSAERSCSYIATRFAYQCALREVAPRV